MRYALSALLSLTRMPVRPALRRWLCPRKLLSLHEIAAVKAMIPVSTKDFILHFRYSVWPV
jgi:hypothetical protein